MKRYYKNEQEFREIHHKLKISQCPYCRLFGTLILHGFLYGYSELGEPDNFRGHRVFCTNRRKTKTGCGKSFSVILASVIKGFIISTGSLWQFLDHIANGMNKLNAFQTLNLPYSTSSVYRLYKRIFESQSKIRSILSKSGSLPTKIETKNPLIQTIFHLKTVFKQACPLTAFQYEFQTSIL